jgi:hypothetical protein
MSDTEHFRSARNQYVKCRVSWILRVLVTPPAPGPCPVLTALSDSPKREEFSVPTEFARFTWLKDIRRCNREPDVVPMTGGPAHLA